MSQIFILPFDHRSTFAKKLLGFDYPPTKSQSKKIIKIKEIVWDAFILAKKEINYPSELAILIDEEFGAKIINKARKTKTIFAVSTEKSGQNIYTFENGDDFGNMLLKIKPDYAKALVRYNPAQYKTNKIQLARLKKLSIFCKKYKIKLIIELLVSGKGTTLKLIKSSIKQFTKTNIKPTIWKLEGLPKASDWDEIRVLTKANIIVLGHGETKKIVKHWIAEAAKSGEVNGFAVGRTIFFKPLEDYCNKKINRKITVEKIAKNYIDFIKLWNRNI